MKSYYTIPGSIQIGMDSTFRLKTNVLVLSNILTHFYCHYFVRVYATLDNHNFYL